MYWDNILNQEIEDRKRPKPGKSSFEKSKKMIEKEKYDRVKDNRDNLISEIDSFISYIEDNILDGFDYDNTISISKKNYEKLTNCLDVLEGLSATVNKGNRKIRIVLK
tara:strand:- start:1168 stop:1491 length:324 start_codon:yes stop_codon:yes gene_type:complete